MKYYAIIVAGGTGSRMNSEIPKQFLLLNGRPVLMHTIEAFHRCSLHPEIILVLNSAYHDYWKQICREHDFAISYTLVDNGEQRFHSVKRGLEFVDANAIVAVHDAVRPIISCELIVRTFMLAEKKGAVVPAVQSRDSVRQVVAGKTVALNREDILLVQTPQVFQSNLLLRAYNQTYSPNFTDDASVVEAAGIEVFTEEGDYRNIKITYPEDLKLAEFLTQA